MSQEAQWAAQIARWLPVVFPALKAHAVGVGAGDRGVLVVEIASEEAARQLGGGTFATIPRWFPAAAFLDMVKGPDGVGPTTADRWAASLAVMDPARDVALFVVSTPDAEGRWFSRFVVTHDGTMSVH